MKIKEAIVQCEKSGLVGIELIEYAQRLINSNMEYSFTNSFDFPLRAFQKGRGYCWQQASTLNYILKKLGFESKLVFSTKNIFPEKEYGGVVVKEHISGHVWCRVRYGGMENDVCPGNINNKFGINHFKIVSNVRRWNIFVCFFSYWGSAVLNYKRFKEIQKLLHS